ncbi:MAG: septum formation initiator family protein [Clostridia bacterium]|nr:septum formation initiator family protein [Clostridia bacterium]
MKKKFRVFDLVVVIVLILAVTLVLNNHFNAQYAALEAEHKALRMEQIQLDSIKSSLQGELHRSDTDAYIMQVAREDYGYLMPGEILFKVSNIDSLYASHEVTLEEAP